MALYKHSGISRGSKHFEFFSEDKDPIVSNPYPIEYPDLSFETEDASPDEVALFEKRKVSADDRNERRDIKQIRKGNIKTLDELADFVMRLAKHVLKD